jgi:hypothetical protein
MSVYSESVTVPSEMIRISVRAKQRNEPMKSFGLLLIWQTRRMLHDRISSMALHSLRFSCLCVPPSRQGWLHWLLAGIVVPWLGLVVQAQSGQDFGWRNYGNDPGGTRYSLARQIDRTNIGCLQLAWTYRTGAMQQETALKRKAAFEATPILADNKLFLALHTTTLLRLIRKPAPDFGSTTHR